jgi:long-chain acyl-CoA synthetase
MGSFDLSSLRTVISGGAALPNNVKASYELAVSKDGVIKQGYGLTEAAPVAASNPPYGLNKSESVGLPMPLTQIKITNPDDPERVLKVGEIGEICIQGPQIMKGYYNKEKETAEVLKNGWLHTGDLGYLDSDFYLHIVDRKKRLILVNGFNVYPSQIESAISQHPAVIECMVISVPDARSGEAAKAFIRLRKNQQNLPTISELKEFLTTHLSRIELPKHIEFVTEELPKTAVGKPDWKTVQERERLKTVSTTETIFPNHGVEQAS